jgi:hypothetical protein
MHLKLITAFTTLALFTACGAAPTESAELNPLEGPNGAVVESGEGNAPAQNREQVAAFQADGATYVFSDNGDAIAIEIAGPQAQGKPLALRLLDQYPELTSLELYLSMAPPGSAVDSRLIDAHSREVVAMNRADATVREVSRSELIVEKASQTNCKNWATSKRGGFGGTVIGSSPTDDATLAQPAHTTTRVAATICNTAWSSSDSGLAATVERRNPGGVWTQVGSSADTGNVFVLPCNCNASDNNAYTYIEAPSASLRRLQINGFFLGAGHTFHLAIAY